MQARHKNRHQYFKEQEYTTRNYVIPYINSVKRVSENVKLLEIGCGEGGNLKPFLDLGCNCTGIDLSEKQIANAKQYFQTHPKKNNLELICEDIYNVQPRKSFDLIMMRDVIEHIPNQEKFMHFLKGFLAPRGIIFFGFPPWQMPFGGHQQVLKSKMLSHTPYVHLLPNFVYTGVMRIFGESDATIDSRLEIKNTGISIERFERILKAEGYTTINRTFYLINPNYEAKFKLKPRKQGQLIAKIPGLRNFFTTAMYYIVSTE